MIGTIQVQGADGVPLAQEAAQVGQTVFELVAYALE
jgi:hypothetical protein